MTAWRTAGAPSTACHPCDQPPGGYRSGDESPADAAMASLARTSILDDPILDSGICDRWWSGSLNGQSNVLL